MAFKERDLYKLTRPSEYPFGSCAIEYKVTKLNRFPFSALKEHQRDALLKAKTSCYFKIPDPQGMSAMNAGRSPFDSFLLRDAQGYVAVLWYKPRKPKITRFLLIETIEDLIQKGIKSITEEEALKHQVYEQKL